MKRTELKQFFTDRPYISVRKVGILIGYSEGKYLIDFLKGNIEQVPPGMFEKLYPILKKCGYDKIQLLSLIKFYELEDPFLVLNEVI